MIQKIRRIFYDLPIAGKLFLLLVICLLIPFLIISVYSYRSARNQLLMQAYENMNISNQQINNNISGQLQIFTQISELVNTNETLKTYLTRTYNKDIEFVEAYRYINDLFFGLMAANSNVNSVTVYVLNPSLPTDGVFIKYLFEKDTPDWIRSMNHTDGNVLYTNIHLNEEGERVFSLVRVMTLSSYHYPYSILALSVKEDYLYSMIRQESAGKDIYVLDSDGKIITTRRKSLISKTLTDVLGSELPDMSRDGYRIMELGGRESLIVYNSMPQGWKTVSVVPLTEILEETRHSASHILFIVTCSFFLAVLGILIISRYFNGRLQLLLRQIRQIEKEDFSSRVAVKGDDEFDQLSKAFNNMTERLNLLINELYKKEIGRRDSELYALQSQINPHFLYNTLSVISSLAIRKGNKEISDIINHLSSFYRTSLNQGKRYISVENELDITRHYIAIQHMRFGNTFQVSYEVDEQLYPCRTLKLVLQPFVENAINHAMDETASPLHIIIRAYRRNKRICFEVEDNGTGIDRKKLEGLTSGKTDTGFGIFNVDERIRLAYGQEYGVQIQSDPGSGTRILIEIPL